MAVNSRNIMLRISPELSDAIVAKRNTIPGGMSFNNYTIQALTDSLKEPIVIEEESITLHPRTMLRLLRLHVVQQLIHAGLTYNEANSVVARSLTPNGVEPLVSKALDEVIRILNC